MHIHRELQ